MGLNTRRKNEDAPGTNGGVFRGAYKPPHGRVSSSYKCNKSTRKLKASQSQKLDGPPMGKWRAVKHSIYVVEVSDFHMAPHYFRNPKVFGKD